MKQVNLKKLIIPNLPYAILGLYATKLGQAWRLAPGVSLADKLLRIMDGLVLAFQSAAPSFHPVDLLVGIACGVGLRFAVCMKGKNARKYRQGAEYGTARWGNAQDIAPYVAPLLGQRSTAAGGAFPAAIRHRPQAPGSLPILQLQPATLPTDRGAFAAGL